MPSIHNDKLYTTIDTLNAKSYNVSTSLDSLFAEICFTKTIYPHSLPGDYSLQEYSDRYGLKHGSHWGDFPLSQITDANSLPLLSLLIQQKLSIDTSLLIEEANNNLSPTFSSNPYPIATRYIDTNGTYYIERPPFQANIDFKKGGASSRTKKRLTDIKVWIPWTLFVFNPKAQKNAMYFSHKSLTTVNDMYFATYLPNSYQDGSICYSSSISLIPEYSTFSSLSVAQIYSFYINEYFAGAWNSDLSNPWSAFLHSVYLFIHSYFPQDEYLYPMIKKLCNPSNEELKKIFGSKTSYINYAIAAKLNNPISIPIQSCDYTEAHQYILTMLSTFSLEEILNLLEEYSSICKLTTEDPTHPYCQHLTRYHHGRSDSFQYYGNFSVILNTALANSSSINSAGNSIANLPEVLKSFASKKEITSPYNFIDTRILILNSVSNTSLSFHSLRYDTLAQNSSSYIYDNFSNNEYAKLLDKVIYDHNIDPDTCSNSLYCYDSLTKQIYVIPYSEETYMHLLKLSVNNQLDIVGYLNATI